MLTINEKCFGLHTSESGNQQNFLPKLTDIFFTTTAPATLKMELQSSINVLVVCPLMGVSFVDIKIETPTRGVGFRVVLEPLK